MFALACRFDPARPLVFEAVASIRRHHPAEEIVVTDSDSPDRSYLRDLERQGVIVEDAGNRCYEAGAMWHVYERYPRDYYYFLHDSVVVKRNLDHLKRLEVSGMMYWDGWGGCQARHLEWARAQLALSRYAWLEDGFHMVFGCMLFCRRAVLDRLYAAGMHHVLPSDKTGSEAMERLLGIALQHEGFGRQIPFTFLTRWKGCEEHEGRKVTRTPQIDKVWLGRQ
ncbi:MAG: hypothetical protein HY812_11950 [Planctomycetes bacterium]|nr:hypothetical protein [Planctomycetota bacterium]